MNETFTVIISAPEGVLFEGTATELRAVNSEGPFSIWADHARFMTVVSDEPLHIIAPNGDEREFTFANAVLFFRDDTAYIYTRPNTG